MCICDHGRGRVGASVESVPILVYFCRPRLFERESGITAQYVERDGVVTRCALRCCCGAGPGGLEWEGGT